MTEPLIPAHGGYRDLKSFQSAELVYDATVKFCDRFIDRRSRTHDQMIQAARSGRQNIAEGSQASGTSKKTELKLVGVARASLEELLLDYQDFLRQRGLALWSKEHPTAQVVRRLAYAKNRAYATYRAYRTYDRLMALSCGLAFFSDAFPREKNPAVFFARPDFIS